MRKSIIFQITPRRIPTSLVFVKPTSGFSIVEVALALALVALSLVAILGLLPVALDGVQRSTEERNATAALRAIQARIMTAEIYQKNGDYYQRVAGVNGSDWRVGGPTFGPWEVKLNSGGLPDNNPAMQVMVARITILPPADLESVGYANIKLAWPSRANWSSNGWVNAKGHKEVSFHFMPRAL